MTASADFNLSGRFGIFFLRLQIFRILLSIAISQYIPCIFKMGHRLDRYSSEAVKC
jgi:hypothetical protein